MLTPEQASGISVFVGTFALPAIIFGSLCKVDLKSMNWSFWLSFFLAKLIVFTAVIVVHRLANRRKRIGISALYGIFVTQSNDFALGLPILNALFVGSGHPEYPNYLFLLAPIQLAILNPIGLILMEISKPKSKSVTSTPVPSSENETESSGQEIANTKIDADQVESSIEEATTKWRKMYNIFLGLFLNPIILMTIAGLFFGTVVFKGQVPVAIDKLVVSVGNSFGALALFTLGLAMVGTMESFKDGTKLIIPVMLITIKTIILPVIAYGITLVLCAGENEAEKRELAGFAFLVGTLPTAPTAYVFASKYDIFPDMIAGSMVVCTIVSAPIIYGSGKDKS